MSTFQEVSRITADSNSSWTVYFFAASTVACPCAYKLDALSAVCLKLLSGLCRLPDWCRGEMCRHNFSDHVEGFFDATVDVCAAFRMSTVMCSTIKNHEGPFRVSNSTINRIIPCTLIGSFVAVQSLGT